LTDEIKSQIASSIGLTGWYLDIWNEFSVLLLDNTALTSGQLGFIYAYLNAIPTGLHNLRSIWVTGNLGTTDPQVSLFGAGSDINIFGTELGAIQGNEFPADVPPGYSDCFCITLVHEVNHIVHAYYICRNLSLLTRHDGLITRAGIDHMNYLRSMLPDGFFVSAPQEFFASTAHQWFTNSSLTLKLALTRFDNGYREPVNQFLLFAEVYSRGGDTTLFYTLDTQGNILRREVPIIRDESGRTTAVIDGQSMYTFSLDEGGHVTAYEISQAPPVLLTDLSVVSGVIRIDATLICPTAITRAEYAVDDTSSPVAIAPVDGVYDSADERIHIEIDVLSYVGLHRIYVRRYDYQGNPSDWLAVDFYVRDLAQRYNLISPKLTPLLGYSAGDLANAIGSSVTVVARWDPTIQGYVSFVPGFSGSELDFPVESEYGYFMYLTSPGKLVEVSSPGSPFSSGG